MARSHGRMVGTRRPTQTQHTFILSSHGSLWFHNRCRYVAPATSAEDDLSLFCSVQSVSGRHHHGKPPDYQTSSMTPPFEETARFLYQNVHQQPIRLFAKSYKSSMIASSLSIRLNQIKSRPLSSVASYHQVPSGTRTGVSCLIEYSDPIHPNKKYTMQLLALYCRGY